MDKYCKRCGGKVKEEKSIKEYPYYCPKCDENMYEFEVERVIIKDKK